MAGGEQNRARNAEPKNAPENYKFSGGERYACLRNRKSVLDKQRGDNKCDEQNGKLRRGKKESSEERRTDCREAEKH